MRYHRKKRGSLILYFLMISFSTWSQKYFTNPLLSSGADPWVIQKNGFYYYTHTTGKNLVIYKTKNLANLRNAEHKIVWQPPANTPYSKEIWAPELHFINGKWYFYFAADNGKNKSHRIYVLENSASDPLKGSWVFKGKVSDSTDKWAIDASVFNYKGKWYMIWSGWEGDTNGEQDIYIARMKNPWTIIGNRIKISRPTYNWETYGDLNDADNPSHVSVNEGPQELSNGKDLFIVYSASGCWTDHYALGLLKLTGKNLLDSSSWQKTNTPVFVASIKDSVFAPGHNSFFKSPNGKEDWILYHANNEPGQGCGHQRSPRAQKFSWNSDGSPNFGTPVKKGLPLLIPSEKFF